MPLPPVGDFLDHLASKNSSEQGVYRDLAVYDFANYEDVMLTRIIVLLHPYAYKPWCMGIYYDYTILGGVCLSRGAPFFCSVFFDRRIGGLTYHVVT